MPRWAMILLLLSGCAMGPDSVAGQGPYGRGPYGQASGGRVGMSGSLDALGGWTR